jgi:Icc-related predicted phosphoesterase
MEKVINDYQPKLWIYGHTHEPDDRMFGDTRVVSNPRGYPLRIGMFECKGYDDQGMVIEV